MTELLVLVQRRLICAATVALAGYLGLEASDATRLQLAALSLVTIIGAGGNVWSYLKARPGVSRRLVAAVVPAIYTALGALDASIPDETRSELAQGVKALLEAVIGQPSPEVLGLMGGAAAIGLTSHLVPNPLSAGRLASPNP